MVAPSGKLMPGPIAVLISLTPPSCAPSHAASLQRHCPSLCWSLLHRAGLHLPDVSCVVGNRAVAGERASMADVEDRLPRPGFGLHVQGTDLCLSLDIGRQVGQVHVVITLGQKYIGDWGEDPRLGRAEGIGGDHVEGAPGLRLMFIVPVWVIPAPVA